MRTCRKSALLILKSRLCYLKKKSGNLLTQNYSSILLGHFELITSLPSLFFFFLKVKSLWQRLQFVNLLVKYQPC